MTQLYPEEAMSADIDIRKCLVRLLMRVGTFTAKSAESVLRERFPRLLIWRRDFVVAITCRPTVTPCPRFFFHSPFRGVIEEGDRKLTMRQVEIRERRHLSSESFGHH